MIIEKAPGQAATQAERDIEAAIARAALFAGRAVRYRPVLGGISNANWRVRALEEDHAYFVKIPGKGTEMFIDRAAAFDASRKAGEAGVGPRVYDDLFDEGVEINDFIADRRPCTNSDFGERAVRLAAIDAYRKLHGVGALGLTKTIFDMIEEHDRQIDELNGWRPPDHPWMMREYRRARQAFEASGIDMAPCFNDPMAGNFMIDEAGSIMLIDYEYASNNERTYDFGVWFGEMFYTPAVERELIEAYYGEVRPEIVARITVQKALADIKWALWSFVQQKVSALDFDFYKYGAWKLMRMRSIMRDPRWVDHLSAI
jgi:thiamine kinase-like enzyme